jgi:hypothetical protein
MFTLSAPDFEAFADEYGEFFNALGRTPSTMLDADALMKLRFEFLFIFEVLTRIFSQLFLYARGPGAGRSADQAPPSLDCPV